MSKVDEFGDVLTVEDALAAIESTQANVCAKLKQLEQARESKRDVMKGYNEDIKQQKEELTALMERLDGLRARQLELAGSNVLRSGQ